MGFPIRKSLDQSPFAAPQGLSQRTTSFIASQHQGIHQIPLRHLIALIINAHPSAEVSGAASGRPFTIPTHPNEHRSHMPGSEETILDFLDQLASTLSSRTSLRASGQRPSDTCGQARRTFDTDSRHPRSATGASQHQSTARTSQPSRTCEQGSEASRSSIPCPIRNRIESLFTMSKSRLLLHEAEAGYCRPQGASSAKLVLASTLSGKPAYATPMVEPDGIEPTTSCLQSRRSPS